MKIISTRIILRALHQAHKISMEIGRGDEEG
jgi:hypothetical protein